MSTKLENHNKAIVQRWIDEVFNAGRVASVDELKVSSYLDWTPLPAPYQDVELPVSGIRDALPEWLQALPDFTFTSDELIADGDFVVCLGRWRAHHRGSYKGHSPTARRVGGTRIDIFRVAGDKMVEHWGCGNELGFMQLIGALGSADGNGTVGSTAGGTVGGTVGGTAGGTAGGRFGVPDGVPDGGPDGGPKGGADEADEDVARRFVESVLARRELTAVADLVDADAVDHSGLALSMLGLLTAFPDLEVTVTGVRRDGADVVVTSAVTGTHRGNFHGAAPTGRRVSGTRADRFRLAGGKIVESWRESDDGALLRQVAA